MRPKLCTFLFLLAATPLHSQSNPDTATPSATLRQNVNNVLVDVVVTDKDGQPITGLTKQLFQLLENGAAQQIAFFEEHQPAPAPVPSEPPPTPTPLPPDVYTDVPSSPPDNGPTLVLLMDALNTQTGEQVKVRQAMLDYLRKIPQGRHIAIFTLAEKLRMIQGFNSDPAALIAALDQAAAWQKTHSRLNDDPGQDTFADFMPSGAPLVDARVIANFINHEQPARMDERVADTLNAITALANYLSAIPGRKSLLWFSGSFPISIGTSDNLQAARNYEEDLRHTADVLKLARVAVYPVDPNAQDTPDMFSATHGDGGTFITDQATGQADNRATAETIAEATGGRAFHNTTDLAGAIVKVTELGSDYYTLAYVSSDKKYDGKYRKVTIKLDLPKARLDYRRGYYAEDPQKSGADAMLHAPRSATVLLHGGPAPDDILFHVQVAPVENAAASRPGTVRYSIHWAIDLKSMSLTPASEGSMHATVSFNLVAYNQDSKQLASATVSKAITLNADQYEKYLKAPVQFQQDIDLPVGPAYLRMAVINTDTDRAGSLEIPLNVRPIPVVGH